MAIILTLEQFKSRLKTLKERCHIISEQEREEKPDLTWKKVVRLLPLMRQSWPRDKVYAVKYLNLLEKYQPNFEHDKRAVVVQAIELMQKVILHKKLNPPPQKLISKRRIQKSP